MIDRCTHPLVSIFPHGPRWVWISPYRLLISPLVWKVPIIPHSHVSSRVTLLTILLSIWVVHFLSVNFPTEPKLLALKFSNPLEMDSCSKDMAHENSPATLFFFFFF